MATSGSWLRFQEFSAVIANDTFLRKNVFQERFIKTHG